MTQLLVGAGRPVVILPGNHDPLTPDSVYRRSAIAELPHVHVLGLTHEQAVVFPDYELEIWGHAHHHYDNMVPLRSPRPRVARWHITLAHGHYEADGAPPLRPSWLISDAERLPRRVRTTSRLAIESRGTGRERGRAGLLLWFA